ncbi:unnamed protein product [Lupinus luteus]|uniref:Uncharacterized protein n=1 Tax=Lupinus luteus TaxID=3873 RepID=A0AAV1YGJ4_LUPLU
MGCGISTLDGEQASSSRCLNRPTHHRTIIKPVTENSPTHKKDFDNGDDGVIKVMKPLGDNEEANIAKEVGSKEEEDRVVLESQEGKKEHGGDHNMHVEKNIENNEEKNGEDNDWDDRFIGPGSPSDHDSINSKTMQKNEQSVDSNKEYEKKDRRGRGFRSVMSRGKRKSGKKNLLNFVCYNASSESNAEGSMNKNK